MKIGNNWFLREKRKFKKAQQLLSPCIDEVGGVWADLGCGEGIFTAILYRLLGRNSEIFAVDKNARALRTLERNFQETYPEAKLHLLHADFTQVLSLPPLDGLILANALHFLKNDQKERVLEDLSARLIDNGKIVIVEYNTDRGNSAVPFPLSADDFLKLAIQLRFRKPMIVIKVPSTFLGEMYAGTALAP